MYKTLYIFLLYFSFGVSPLLGYTLRTSIYRAYEVDHFDPLLASGAWHKTVSYSLYARLFSETILENGDIMSDGLVKDYKWVDGVLTLTLKEDHVLLNGKKLTPRDVVFSLKRSFVKSDNLLPQLLKSLLCGSKMKNISDPCDGLYHDKKTISMKFDKHLPGIPILLENNAFSIIPESAIDKKTLEIKKYDLTTGPYYYAGKNSQGHLILKQNPNHWQLQKNSPSVIDILPDEYEKIDNRSVPTSFIAFIKGDIDFIALANIWYEKSFFNRASSKQPSKSFTTNGNSSNGATFTYKGMTELTIEERRRISFDIQSTIQKYLYEKRNKKNHDDKIGYRRYPGQFIPSGKFGSLSTRELDIINEHWKKSKGKYKGRKVILGANPVIGNFLRPVLKHLDYLEIVDVDIEGRYELIDEKNYKSLEFPDLIELAVGFSTEDSIGALSYLFDSGIFKQTENKPIESMIIEFLSMNNEDLIAYFKKIHFSNLFENPGVIPFWTSSKSLIIRDNYSIAVSKNSYLTPFYSVSKK